MKHVHRHALLAPDGTVIGETLVLGRDQLHISSLIDWEKGMRTVGSETLVGWLKNQMEHVHAYRGLKAVWSFHDLDGVCWKQLFKDAGESWWDAEVRQWEVRERALRRRDALEREL